MSIDKNLWEQVVNFHGHECIGLANGYRVAEAAIDSLGINRDVDEEIVAIVENDSCAVDAIQVVTGCTYGKGNLIFHDYGKQAYSFLLRENGKGVRITLKALNEEKHKDIMALREKIASGKAEEEEKEPLKSKVKEIKDDILSRPLSEVCQVQKINHTFPQKAQIFSSVTCNFCGEKVMEPRARIKDGQPSCIPCAWVYAR